LPKPLKPPEISNVSFSEQSKPRPYPSIHHRDRRTYKNLSIYVTELPPTPEAFRHKHYQTREKEAGRIKRDSHYEAVVYDQRRPHSNVIGYVSKYHVPARPHTFTYIDSHGIAPGKGRQKKDTSEAVLSSQGLSAPDENTQQWIANNNQDMLLIEEMTAATLDKDFEEEFATIKQWFRVLSDAERTAGLYALAQQMKHENIGFFLRVLQYRGRETLSASLVAFE
jgi:hypothetical protein